LSVTQPSQYLGDCFRAGREVISHEPKQIHLSVFIF